MAPRGIATFYEGVRFRSRLEARWACFFDCVGWEWTYEATDEPGWIPDFVLHLPTPTLVEVKPAMSFAALSEYTTKIDEAIRSAPKFVEALVVGVSPIAFKYDDIWPALGLMRAASWGPALVRKCNGETTFCHAHDGLCRVHGDDCQCVRGWCGDEYRPWEEWGYACNHTQWRAAC